MSKDKFGIIFFITYLTSYILLTFEYINSNFYFPELLDTFSKVIGVNWISLTLLFLFCTVFMGIILYLIPYNIIVFLVRKVSRSKFNSEQLSIALLLSETISNVFALLFISIFPTLLSVLVILIPIVNLIVFYTLLKTEYKKDIILPIMIIKVILYSLNFILLFTGILTI